MFELIDGIQSLVENCMKIRPKERVLIIADNEAGPMWIGQLAMNVINKKGGEAILTIITPRKLTDEEPPVAVASAMKNVEAILEISDRYPMVHSNARKEITALGVRHYVIHRASLDDLMKGVSVEDIQTISKRTEDLVLRLNQAKSARITSPLGTELSMNLTSRKGIAIHPSGGVGSGLPFYAEAAIAPVEGTSEGIVIADLAIPQWRYVFREPLRYTVEAGKIVDVSGRAQDVDRLRKIITIDENASNIAELGIGTSHMIQSEVIGTRNDAARIGTAHIGIGRNNDIGGETWSRIHIDTLMSQVIIELDGHRVLGENTLLL